MTAGAWDTILTPTILTPETRKARDLALGWARINQPNEIWQPLPDTRIADLRIFTLGAGITADLKKALGDIEQ